MKSEKTDDERYADKGCVRIRCTFSLKEFAPLILARIFLLIFIMSVTRGGGGGGAGFLATLITYPYHYPFSFRMVSETVTVVVWCLVLYGHVVVTHPGFIRGITPRSSASLRHVLK